MVTLGVVDFAELQWSSKLECPSGVVIVNNPDRDPNISYELLNRSSLFNLHHGRIVIHRISVQKRTNIYKALGGKQHDLPHWVNFMLHNKYYLNEIIKSLKGEEKMATVLNVSKITDVILVYDH